ncbi:MAG: Txe/YoeB family addiction module toxin [Candidatus Saccharimonadales bacterium]
MRLLTFTPNGWEEHVYWQEHDKKIARKINHLIKEIMRTPFSGSGKPELLTGDYSGYWSRRIDDKHRLVYSVSDEQILIAQCRFHYRKS